MANTDNVVKFLYDTPIEDTNAYGMYHLYGFEKDGEETGLFATDALHEKLKNFTKGDSINIRKEEYEAGKFGWNVVPEEGTPTRQSPPPSVNGSYNPTKTADDRTLDIHRQVCLKLAVQSMDTIGGIDSATVKLRMETLLDVLDGKKTKEELPF